MNNRLYTGNIAPSPVIYDYWADTAADPYGKVIKYYDGTNWIDLHQNNGAGATDPELINKVNKISDDLKDLSYDFQLAQNEIPEHAQLPYYVNPSSHFITEGYLEKDENGHYSKDQYRKMYNNAYGFTDALRTAYVRGYTGIVFPKGKYCFCDTSATTRCLIHICNLTNFDINFNGSELYFLIDTTELSPYAEEDREPIDQHMIMMEVDLCQNLTIRNAVLIGDRELRTYENIGGGFEHENQQQGSYGLSIGGCSRDITVLNIETYNFMGDGITSGQGRWYAISLTQKTNTFNWRRNIGKRTAGVGYRVINNEIIHDYSRWVTLSDFVSLDGAYTKDMDYTVRKKLGEERIFVINNNLGYTRLINCYFPRITVLCYDDNSDEPLRVFDTAYLEPFKLFKNETRIRVQFNYEAFTAPEWDETKQYAAQEFALYNGKIYRKKAGGTSTVGQFIENEWYDGDNIIEGGVSEIESDCVIEEALSDNLRFENCYIHDNQRGGYSGGGINVSFYKCRFQKTWNYDNRESGPISYRESTYYHIDFEDNYGSKFLADSCTFIGAKMLLGVYSYEIRNCYIRDYGVITYNCYYGSIHDNIFMDSIASTTTWYRDRDYDEPGGKNLVKRVVHVYANRFEGNVAVRDGYSNTYFMVHDNYFDSINYGSVCFNNNAIYYNNYFKINRPNLNYGNLAPMGVSMGNNVYDCKMNLDYYNCSYDGYIPDLQVDLGEPHIGTVKDSISCGVIIRRDSGDGNDYLCYMTGIKRLGFYPKSNKHPDNYTFTSKEIDVDSNDVCITHSNGHDFKTLKFDFTDCELKITGTYAFRIFEDYEGLESVQFNFKNCDFSQSTIKTAFLNSTTSKSKTIVNFENCKLPNDLKLFQDSTKPICAKSGPTENRPDGNVIDMGYEYYDTTENKFVKWTGSEWI